MVLYEQEYPLSASKILIVDDSPSDTSVLSMAISELDANIEIEIVSDGQRALEFVGAQRGIVQGPKPCVIVLDLHLPKHDGLEILRAICQEPVLNHIKVVVLTGTASGRELNELERMGAHYRNKPMALSGFSELAADLVAICRGFRAAA